MDIPSTTVITAKTLIDGTGAPPLERPAVVVEDGKITALDVKSGDRILYGKWSGTEVKIDGKDLLIMKESDIMGIIE